MIRVLDLFCGAGGAAMGIHQALEEAGLEHEIVGVDIKPQPRYPFKFFQDDALKFLPLDGFDFIWTSPPCQAHSWLRAINGLEYTTFIEPIRMRLDALTQSWIPKVIENVVGSPLINPIQLCGSMFSLGVWRHRLFETTFPIVELDCKHSLVPEPLDITGTGGPCHMRTTPGGGLHRKPKNMQQANKAMGIDWMTRREITQAIPPAYSRYIIQQWLGQRGAL
jgi:DNA (cytosine-5)-methyltransferase 1